jgi:hypothetical protein
MELERTGTRSRNLRALLVGTLVAVSCRTPNLEPLSAEALEAGPFAFVRDGETTREDLLL